MPQAKADAPMRTFWSIYTPSPQTSLVAVVIDVRSQITLISSITTIILKLAIIIIIILTT